MEQVDREALAKRSMRLVDKVVASELRKLGDGFSREDLRSFALEGLAEALERFDPNRNIAFSTFAMPRIRGALYDGVSQYNWLPRGLRRQIRFYQQAEEMLHYQEDLPKPADQVEAVHQLADRLKELATAYVTSYVAEAHDETVPQSPDAESALERKRWSAQLRTAVRGLPPKQQQVVESYYFSEMNLAQISVEMHISKSWASKLLSAGLRSLRYCFDDQPIFMNESEPTLYR
jgi:RNA polymerase sigma factor for flagellar operon FliA